MTIRVESRNAQGRIVSVLERDFSYTTPSVLHKWCTKEINDSLYAGNTVTITRLADE